MRKQIWLASIVMIILMGISVWADEAPKKDNNAEKGLKLTISADKAEYLSAEPVVINWSLVNTSKEDINITMGFYHPIKKTHSLLNPILVILDEKKEEILYNGSLSQGFNQPENASLKAGDEIKGNIKLDKTILDKLASGKYHLGISIEVKKGGERLNSNLITFNRTDKIDPKLQEKIEQLITELGADNFKTREDATEELTKIGLVAVPSLKRATENKDPEVKMRVNRVLKELETEKTEFEITNPYLLSVISKLNQNPTDPKTQKVALETIEMYTRDCQMKLSADLEELKQRGESDERLEKHNEENRILIFELQKAREIIQKIINERK